MSFKVRILRAPACFAPETCFFKSISAPNTRINGRGLQLISDQNSNDKIPSVATTRQYEKDLKEHRWEHEHRG